MNKFWSWELSNVISNHHLPSIHPLPCRLLCVFWAPSTKYSHTAPAIVSYIKQPSSSSSSSSSSVNILSFQVSLIDFANFIDLLKFPDSINESFPAYKGNVLPAHQEIPIKDRFILSTTKCASLSLSLSVSDCVFLIWVHSLREWKLIGVDYLHFLIRFDSN